MNLTAKALEDQARGLLAMSLASYALDVPLALMSDVRRSPAAAFARKVAMYVAHTGMGMTLGRVAAAFGRDRSTVASACRAIERQRDDPQFNRWLEALEHSAAAAPAPFRGAPA